MLDLIDSPCKLHIDKTSGADESPGPVIQQTYFHKKSKLQADTKKLDKLDWAAPVVPDPPKLNSTIWQNLLNCDPPFIIAF